MLSKYYSIDAATGLIKRELGSAAVTADGYIGDQWDQGGAIATDFAVIIDIEACKVSAGNETYMFSVVGSQTADRSDRQILVQKMLGDAGSIAMETVDTAVGQRHVLWTRSELNDTEFRYIDLHLDVSGTAPSITFGAFISKEV